jgi:hypothetical protein
MLSSGFPISELTQEELKKVREVASARVIQHINDAKSGDIRALNSYGEPTIIDRRDDEEREKDAYKGALAEYIASRYAKCEWSAEMGQYKGNKNPDLRVVFQNKSVYCDVRGTGSGDRIIYRPHQDYKKDKCILIGVTSLPSGPICGVGWSFFYRIKELVRAHSNQKIDNGMGKPYYAIPFENFSQDFSEFGGKDFSEAGIQDSEDDLF